MKHRPINPEGAPRPNLSWSDRSPTPMGGVPFPAAAGFGCWFGPCASTSRPGKVARSESGESHAICLREPRSAAPPRPRRRLCELVLRHGPRRASARRGSGLRRFRRGGRRMVRPARMGRAGVGRTRIRFNCRPEQSGARRSSPARFGRPVGRGLGHGLAPGRGKAARVPDRGSAGVRGGPACLPRRPGCDSSPRPFRGERVSAFGRNVP